MNITRKHLRKLIKEELEDQYWDVESPTEVVPLEDAWAGGEDLVNPVDHSEEGGSEAVTVEPEVLEITERIWRHLRRFRNK